MSTKAARAIAPLNDYVRRALELCEEFDASADYFKREKAHEEVKGILFHRIPEDPGFSAFVNRNSEFYVTYLGLRDIAKRNDAVLLEERFQKLRRGSQSQSRPQQLPPLRKVQNGEANPPYPMSPTSGDTKHTNGKMRMPEPATISQPKAPDWSPPKTTGKDSNVRGPNSVSNSVSNSASGSASASASTTGSDGSENRIYELSPAIVQNKIAVSKVLMIDIRPHDEFDAGHIDNPLITCFEPASLRLGMTERDLEDALVISAASEFDSFAQRDDVDMIVIYDQHSRTAAESPALTIVYQALADAGRPSYVLRGGFNAWCESLQAKGNSHGSIRTGFASASRLPEVPQLPPSPPKHEIWPAKGSSRSSASARFKPSPPLPPKEAISPPTASMPKVPEPLLPHASYTFSERSSEPPHMRSPPLPAQPPPPVPAAHLSRQSSFPSRLPRSAGSNYSNSAHATRSAAQSQILSGYADTPAKSGLASLRVPKLFNPPQRTSSLSPTTTPSKYSDTRSTPPADSYLHRLSSGSPSYHPYHGHQTSSDAYSSRSDTSSMGDAANGHANGYSQAVVTQNGSGSSNFESQVPAKLISTTGLVNLGNTCYMNCIIQCLLGVPQLTEPFSNGTFVRYINLKSKLGYKGRFANVFARLVRAMTEHQGGSVAPNEMKSFAGELRPDSFAGYEQQDCQEFLTFVLDGLHEDLNSNGDKPKEGELDPQAEEHREAMGIRIASAIEWERYLKGDTSLIVDLFQGQYLSRLQCMSCKQTSTTYNAFSSLSLPIVTPKLLGQQTTLKACFDEFVKPELLDGDNAWFCPRCKKKRRTVKTLQISRLPPVLVIHLKRFKRSSLSGVNKLETAVDYPLRDLDLTRYWPQLRQSEFSAKEAEMLQQIPSRGQNPPFIYDLRAVTLHHGSLKGGHYTSVVQKPGHGWLYYDDSNVYPVKEKAAVSKQAYVLIYKRQM